MVFTVAAMATLTLLTASPEDSLIGRWGIPHGDKPRVFVDLRPNRLAQVVVTAGLWTATEKELRLVDPEQPDKRLIMPYSLEGDTLTIVLDKSPLTLARLEAPAEYKAPAIAELPQVIPHGFVKAGSDVYTLAHHDGGFMAISATTWVHMPGASAASFEGMAKGVGKDANGVYCFTDNGGQQKAARLEAADPKTFRVLLSAGRVYFADATNVFTECRRLVQRRRFEGKTRLVPFDSQTFALGPCSLLKDRSGAYASVPLPDAFADRSKMEEVLALQEELDRRQLWVYERVMVDRDTLKDPDCNELLAPAPLRMEDLAADR